MNSVAEPGIMKKNVTSLSPLDEFMRPKYALYSVRCSLSFFDKRSGNTYLYLIRFFRIVLLSWPIFIAQERELL